MRVRADPDPQQLYIRSALGEHGFIARFVSLRVLVSASFSIPHWPTYIDLRRGTPFSLAWLVADGNLGEGGLAWLIGSVFKKGFALLYSSYTEFGLLLFNGTD